MDVEAFLRKFGMPVPDEPTLHDVGIALHRVGLIEEELIEYDLAVKLALTAQDDEERRVYYEDMIDALGDIIYATIGTAIIHGFDIVAALDEIHRANMEKERGIGKRGHACDVIKPPGWRPPKHHLGRRKTRTTPSVVQQAGSSSSSSQEPWQQLSLPGI